MVITEHLDLEGQEARGGSIELSDLSIVPYWTIGWKRRQDDLIGCLIMQVPAEHAHVTMTTCPCNIQHDWHPACKCALKQNCVPENVTTSHESMNNVLHTEQRVSLREVMCVSAQRVVPHSRSLQYVMWDILVWFFFFGARFLRMRSLLWKVWPKEYPLFCYRPFGDCQLAKKKNIPSLFDRLIVAQWRPCPMMPLQKEISRSAYCGAACAFEQRFFVKILTGQYRLQVSAESRVMTNSTFLPLSLACHFARMSGIDAAEVLYSDLSCLLSQSAWEIHLLTRCNEAFKKYYV